MEQNLAQNLNQDFQKSKAWLVQHERMIIVFMILVFVYLVLNKGFDLVSRYEDHKAAQAQTVLDIQKAKNDTELATAKEMLGKYQTAYTNTNKLIASYNASQVSRDKQLETQKQVDKKLEPSQLALRWQGIIGNDGIQPASEASVVTGGYVVSNEAAFGTLALLEENPVLKQDLSDEKAKQESTSASLSNANDLIGQGKIVVDGLKLELTDKEKQCSIALDAEKAKARKGKWKWFGIGYVTGFVSGVTLHLW